MTSSAELLEMLLEICEEHPPYHTGTRSRIPEFLLGVGQNSFKVFTAIAYQVMILSAGTSKSRIFAVT